MRRNYTGKIKNLNKIIISDPSYSADDGMRYEKNFNDMKNLDVILNINEVDDVLLYEKEVFNAKGIEFSILIKNPENTSVELSNNNTIEYENGKYEKVNKYEIAMDTACVSLGINKHADLITDSKDDWLPGCALNTGTDGLFGEVNEGLNSNKTEFIGIYGFLDEGTGYTFEEIKNYLIENLEVEELTLQGEIDDKKDLHRVIFKQPGREPEIIKIEKGLRAEQELVGGLIETVPFTDKTILVCNEEGKLMGLPPNIRYGNNDVIAGSFFIIGDDEENCDFRSLTEEEINECINKIYEFSLGDNEEQESI